MIYTKKGDVMVPDNSADDHHCIPNTTGSGNDLPLIENMYDKVPSIGQDSVEEDYRCLKDILESTVSDEQIMSNGLLVETLRKWIASQFERENNRITMSEKVPERFWKCMLVIEAFFGAVAAQEFLMTLFRRGVRLSSDHDLSQGPVGCQDVGEVRPIEEFINETILNILNLDEAASGSSNPPLDDPYPDIRIVPLGTTY